MANFNRWNQMTIAHVFENRSDDEVIAWLREHGLLATSRTCAEGHEMVLEKRERGPGLFRCRKKHVSNKAESSSILAKSWFSMSKLTLKKVMRMTYAFARNYSFADAINETSDYDFNQVTSSETVSDWYSYCREAVSIYMVEKMETDGRIGGPNHVVEIDETKIGKRKYNVGRLKEGYWILGMIDRTTKDFRLEICPDNSRSSDSLVPLIQKHVAEGSLIMTDQ